MVVESESTTIHLTQQIIQQNGHGIAGMATSCEEATKIFLREKPNLSLIGLPMCSREGCIELAQLMRQHSRPFLLMASVLDEQCIELVRQTLPTGLLTKPVQPKLLLAQIEIALHHFRRTSEPKPLFTPPADNHLDNILLTNILYLQSDHVYVQIHTTEGDKVLHRSSLTEILRHLPPMRFVQTHRSFAVNIHKLSHWDDRYVYVQEQAIPLSRSRRRKVLSTVRKVTELV
ncbi:MAG: LytTR family transcriptional regulator DNA-binding domain-containing protein [Lewinella sp.]|nr:LytTR family transcriptional regulator DNA-binding domain-containing protein [Lewinella sp.]